ncbi:YihA family ribosome biogenesis GTP-binding protein [bacterium]|nr:YihA family ribosome biogenesis GTP-binding protein [bacterium]
MAQFLEAKFVKSAEKLSQCPESELPEFPLLGRSNVGKSSFINAIANQKHLAKTSNTPGKTRLINYFNFSDKFMIADLPGYGYAKVSKTAQNQWQKYLEEYLLKREQLTSLIQFIDGRHEVQKNDIQMREWVLHYNLPVITVVTKADCISKNQLQKSIAQVRKVFGGEIFPFSANNSYYNEEILNYLTNL